MSCTYFPSALEKFGLGLFIIFFQDQELLGLGLCERMCSL